LLPAKAGNETSNVIIATSVSFLFINASLGR
jgi:hypothetical protein